MQTSVRRCSSKTCLPSSVHAVRKPPAAILKTRLRRKTSTAFHPDLSLQAPRYAPCYAGGAKVVEGRVEDITSPMPVPSLDDKLFERKSSSSSSSSTSSSSSSSSGRPFDQTRIVRFPSDVEICSDSGSDTFDVHQQTQGAVLPRPKSAVKRNFYQELLRASWNENRMEQVSDNENDGPYDSIEHYEYSNHHGRNASGRVVPGAEQIGDAGEVRAVLHELRVLASLLLLPEAGD